MSRKRAGQETADIMQGYDPALLKKLFGFLTPHKVKVGLALVALVLTTLGELALPVILQSTLDGPILGRQRLLEAAELEQIGFAPQETAQLKQVGNQWLAPSRLWDSVPARFRSLGTEVMAGQLDPRAPETDRWLERNQARILNLDHGLTVMTVTEYEALAPADRDLFRALDYQAITWAAGGMFLILLVILGANFFQVYLLAVLSQKVMVDLRMRLYRHFIHQSSRWMNKNPVGRLVSAVTSDVSTISEFFNTFFTSMLKDLALMVGALVTLFGLNRDLALYTLISLPPVVVLVAVFRRLSRRAEQRSRAQTSRIQAFLAEHLAGISLVQLFRREQVTAGKFAGENQNLLKANLAGLGVNAVFRPLIDILFAISLGVIIFFGSGMHAAGLLSLGVLIAFINLISKFYQPVGSMAENFTMLQSAMAGAERVFGFLGQTDHLPDTGKLPLLRTGDFSIEFDRVEFAYNPEEPVLKGVTFKLPAGQTWALVGYTGSGKTTITSLLTRLWDPDAGSIKIGGRDLTEYELKAVRGQVQSVLQEVFLFSGTIRENIDLGRGLSQDQLTEICRIAQIHDFIESLPQGYETQLNEGATNLSSGQRQLLSFARVLAQNPGVLILDEATANVDTDTEHRLQKAMAELTRNRTSLIIAHRLSTIRHVDQILVLNGGVVAEQGTHDELMARGGLYFNLYKLQYEHDDPEGTEG